MDEIYFPMDESAATEQSATAPNTGGYPIPRHEIGGRNALTASKPAGKLREPTHFTPFYHQTEEKQLRAIQFDQKRLLRQADICKTRKHDRKHHKLRGFSGPVPKPGSDAFDQAVDYAHSKRTRTQKDSKPKPTFTTFQDDITEMHSLQPAPASQSAADDADQQLELNGIVWDEEPTLEPDSKRIFPVQAIDEDMDCSPFKLVILEDQDELVRITAARLRAEAASCMAISQRNSNDFHYARGAASLFFYPGYIFYNVLFHSCILAPVYEECIKHVPYLGIFFAHLLGMIESLGYYKCGRLSLTLSVVHYLKHMASVYMPLPLAILLHMVHNAVAYYLADPEFRNYILAMHYKPGSQHGRRSMASGKVAFKTYKHAVLATQEVTLSAPSPSTSNTIDKGKERAQADIVSMGLATPDTVITTPAVRPIQPKEVVEPVAKPVAGVKKDMTPPQEHVRDGVRPTIAHLDEWLDESYPGASTKYLTDFISDNDYDHRILSKVTTPCDRYRMYICKWKIVSRVECTLFSWLSGPGAGQGWLDWLENRPRETTQTIYFCPHLISIALNDTPLRTNIDALKSNARSKISRTPALNIPDRLDAEVMAGSELLYVIIAQSQLNSSWVPINGPFGTQWSGTASKTILRANTESIRRFTPSDIGPMKPTYSVRSRSYSTRSTYKVLLRHGCGLVISVASTLALFLVTLLSLWTEMTRILSNVVLLNACAAILSRSILTSCLISFILLIIGLKLTLPPSRSKRSTSGSRMLHILGHEKRN